MARTTRSVIAVITTIPKPASTISPPATTTPKSTIARKCFDDVGLKVEDDFNKVKVKTSLHRRLHTNIYYGLINTGVLIAYAIGRDKDSKAKNIKAFVGAVGGILMLRE